MSTKGFAVFGHFDYFGFSRVQNMRTIFIACWAVALTLMPPAIVSAQVPQLEKGPAGSAVYTIQPGDVLKIVVHNEPNVSDNYTVRPDGRISLPYIKDVKAAGLSTELLGQKIEERLKDFMDAPNVAVILAHNGYHIFVLGRVRKEGEIRSELPLTITQALSIAGGLTDYTTGDDIIILHGGGEDTKPFRFNYQELLNSKNFSQNMFLKSGDQIIVVK
jgi:polysaccharide export outer membrane protein